MSEIEKGFSEQTQSILQEQLAVHKRQGAGATYEYFKGEDVIRQLNKAFGHCWSSEVISAEEAHGQILVQAAVWVYADGFKVVHHGYSSSAIAVNKATKAVIDIGNAYKSAYTGAIKKAAEQFGIGLGDGESVQKPVTPASSYKKAEFTAKSQSFTPPPTSLSPTPGARPSLRPSGGLKPRVNESKLAPSTNNAQAAAAPTQETAPTGASSFSAGDDELSELCTDVQKGAIQRLTSRKSITVDKAIAEALGNTAKNIDTLTKAEAALVIRYSNTIKVGA